ncbi:hypothetical protein [Mycobacterium ostraviense]|uniref:hypothetical protein n=1 Tax=Mycobacterium ostraviense TaxID=2738409 RepID=UPI001290202F|nr:hypothetical protein [Mycobacterium ostraviense]
MGDDQSNGRIYVTADLGPVEVRPINGYPGRYWVGFGEFHDVAVHVTAEQWDAIDAAVRAGIAAAQAPQQAAS